MSENETSMPLDPLAGWVHSFREAVANRAYWQEQERVAKEQIKRVMSVSDATVGTIQGQPAVRAKRYIRHGLDSRGLKRDHPDLCERYEVSTPVESLSIVEK